MTLEPHKSESLKVTLVIRCLFVTDPVRLSVPVEPAAQNITPHQAKDQPQGRYQTKVEHTHQGQADNESDWQRKRRHGDVDISCQFQGD
jgi:hypothetical protein